MLTPDDIMDNATVTGPVVIWDDDHYYMAGVMAEVLAKAGHTVTHRHPPGLDRRLHAVYLGVRPHPPQAGISRCRGARVPCACLGRRREGGA